MTTAEEREDNFWERCLQDHMLDVYAETLLDKVHKLLDRVYLNRNIQQPFELRLVACEVFQDDETLQLHIPVEVKMRVWNVNAQNAQMKTSDDIKIFERDLNEKRFFPKIYKGIVDNFLHEIQEGFEVDHKPFKPPVHRHGRWCSSVAYKFPELNTRAWHLATGK